MTVEELNEIIARADQASPGPYTIDKMQNGEYHIYSKFLRCVAAVVHPLEHQQRLDAEFFASAKEDICKLVEMVHHCSKRIAELEQVDATYTPRDLKDAMRVIALQRERIALLARQAERFQKAPAGTRAIPIAHRVRPRRVDEAPAEASHSSAAKKSHPPRVVVSG